MPSIGSTSDRANQCDLCQYFVAEIAASETLGTVTDEHKYCTQCARLRVLAISWSAIVMTIRALHPKELASKLRSDG